MYTLCQFYLCFCKASILTLQSLDIDLKALLHCAICLSKYGVASCRGWVSHYKVRWPTSVTAQLTFSRHNLLSHGTTYFLHGTTYFLHCTIYFLTAQLIFFTPQFTFSRHNLLFSRRNSLSHGKNYFFLFQPLLFY